MDGIHIVDKGLHRLVHTVNGTVNGMLLHAFIALHKEQILDDIILHRCIVQMLQVHTGKIFDILHFLDVAFAHVRCQIEVECRDSLSAMHFVLHGLHGDTCHDGSRFDALGRT